MCKLKEDQLVEQYKDIILETLKSFPCIEYIMKECWGTVYGGVIREIIYHTIKYNELDPLKKYQSLKSYVYYKIQDYLVKGGDIDISLRNCFKQALVYMKKILTYLLKNGAYIEYNGNFYSLTGAMSEPLPDMEISKEGKGFRYGNYIAWMAIDTGCEEEWVRYDITLHETSQLGFFDDYTVNMINIRRLYEYDLDHVNKPVKYCMFMNNDAAPAFKDVLEDIREKNMRICCDVWPNTFKVLYRMKKMWKKGYLPVDIPSYIKSLKLLIKYKDIDDLFNKEKLNYKLFQFLEMEKVDDDDYLDVGDHVRAYSCDDKMSMPSRLEDDQSIIRPTKYEYKEVKFRDFIDDKVINDIIDYIINNS